MDTILLNVESLLDPMITLHKSRGGDTLKQSTIVFGSSVKLNKTFLSMLLLALSRKQHISESRYETS